MNHLKLLEYQCGINGVTFSYVYKMFRVTMINQESGMCVSLYFLIVFIMITLKQVYCYLDEDEN